jgi:hypothetical protein
VSLYQRYELLDLNRDDGVKTFEAREIATGRPVKVHIFVRPAAPLQAALLKAIERLPESARQRIIEQGKHEGTPYLVTDRLVDYPGLGEWVQAVGQESKSQPPKTVLAAPPPPTPTGAVEESALNQQFVELFTTAERPALADGLQQSTKRPQSAPPVRPPETLQKAPAEPGEFTRMFQMPRGAAPSAPPAVPPASTEAGEFTKMFQAPTAPTAPPPAPAAEPGEFTRMFQANLSPPAAPPQPPAGTKSGPDDFEQLFQTQSPVQPLPSQAGPNRAGESTRPLGKGGFDPPPAPPAAAPAAKQPGEFTRMFQFPGAAPATPRSAQPPATMPMAVPQSGADEHTRPFSLPAQLPLGRTSAPPAPSPQAYAPPAMTPPAMPNMEQAPLPPKKSKLPLILGIAGIVLVIALLAVFFLMRTR